MAVVFSNGRLVAPHIAMIGRLPTVLARQQATVSAERHESSIEDAQVKPTSEIPGPRIYPIVGSLFSMGKAITEKVDHKSVHRFWQQAADYYGPIMRMRIPAMPEIVAVTNPDDCEVLLRATMENPVRYGFGSLKKIRQEAADDFFQSKSGLLPENGEEWKRVRSRVQTPMMKPNNVNSYLSEMDQITLEFMDRIAAIQEEHKEMPSDFIKELYKWALESVSLVALGRRMGCLNPNLTSDSEPMEFINTASDIFEGLNSTEFRLQFWRIFPTPTYRKLKKAHEKFLRMVDQNFKKTEAELMAKDLKSDEHLTLMEKLLLTPGLSRTDVITLIMDMIFAGIDTTSHTLGFTLYLLSRNTDSQAKLQEEVDRVLRDHKGPITPKELAKLSYLKAVVKESLRIYPVTIGMGRILEKDVVLSGYTVPKGFTVFTLNMVMSHDEKIFPRAKEFVPERWLRHRPLGPIHPYASLPFGSGTRMCIGRRIAEQEMYVFLARLMQRFTVDYKYEDIDIVSRFVFIPSQPLRFSFTQRNGNPVNA